MADDNILRSYRSNDATRRARSAAASGRDAGNSDPLAELARLIGQSDPFADMDHGRGQGSASGAGSASYGRSAAFEAEPPRTDNAPADWRKEAAAMARESLRESSATEQRYAEVDSAIAAAKSLRTPPEDHFSHSAGLAQHAAYDQPTHPQDPYADVPYTDPAYADPAYADPAYADTPYADPPYEDGPRGNGRFENRAPDFAAQPTTAADSEDYFFDGAPVPAEQAFYDDPPRPRASNSIVTALVLFGCGILGTAGAYGYRTYYSSSRPIDAPIIAADKTPNKVVPAATASDGQSGKSAERVGSGSERVVARQEEPVALPDPANPRVVLPAPYPAAPGPANSSAAINAPSVQATLQSPVAAPAATVTSSTSGPATAPDGTKKVHTIAIHPTDGGDPLARPISNPPGASAPAISPPAANQHQAAVTRPAPASSHNSGPLSLDPQGTTASSYQPVSQDRPRAPAPAASGGTQLASASSSPASVPASPGGHMVQISSQRNEADAQLSIRSLQAKFPNQLGGREVAVSRADLGSKGVYYRAMVGPFDSANDAAQFCSSLKAAGGDCIVHKN